jgi:hypothetical protein
VITACRGRVPIVRAAISVTRRQYARDLRWCIDPERLAFDDDRASPWLIVPTEVRDAFDLLTSAGAPVAESPLGRPHLGVKCGCNAAFVVTARGGTLDGESIEVEVAGRRARIERSLLRPVIRGETLRGWTVDRRAEHEHIVWAHDNAGAPLRALPPLARHWLAPWRRRLMARSDAHGRTPWWSLFRIDAARSDRPRVVWADLGRTPRALVLPAGDPSVPLNSCYVVSCSSLPDAYAFAALLNSRLAAAWLDALAEPARGGYRRYLGWTTALLPVPIDWRNARAVLAPLGAQACNGAVPRDDDLLEATLAAYGLDRAEIASLLDWKRPCG